MEEAPTEGEAEAATANKGKALKAIDEDEESNSDGNDYSALEDKPSPSPCRVIDDFYKEFQ